MSDDASLCQVTLVENGVTLADRVRPAHTHWTRLRGLLGTRGLAAGEGLWLSPCSQVHMIGMRYPIDVAFLDADLTVVRTVADLRPGAISPKVANATSVLELRSGRLAELGVASGQRLAIEPGCRRTSTSDDVAATLLNVFLALLFAAFAGVHLTAAWRTGNWPIFVPIVIQESLLVGLFLTRRPTRVVAREPLGWVTGVVGTFLPLLFRPADVSDLYVLGASIQALGLVLAVLALTSLGRSIGVVPAHRGIKTVGMYGFVRHPMYAAYVVAHLGYIVSFPSLRNVLIGTITALSFHLRAGFEERLLTQDPQYADYTRRVTWRFLPHIY